MERTFDNVKITSSFEVPETRNNLVSGETIGKHFGNIAKNIEVLGEHIDNQTIHAKVWKGTQEEYNAIEPKEDDTVYIIKDSDNTLADKLIDDSTTTATDKTWSVKKINESIPTNLHGKIYGSTNKDIFSETLSNDNPCWNKWVSVSGNADNPEATDYIPNCPETPSNGVWYEVLTGTNDGRAFQLAVGCFRWQRTVHIRYCHDSVWSGWNNIADGGNADTLDGKHAVDFLQPIAITGVSLGFTVGQEVSVTEFVNALADKFGNEAQVFAIVRWYDAEMCSIICDDGSTIAFNGGFIVGKVSHLTEWSSSRLIYYPANVTENGYNGYVIRTQVTSIGYESATISKINDGGNATTLENHPASDFASAKSSLKWVGDRNTSHDCNDCTESGWYFFNGCGGHSPLTGTTSPSGTYIMLEMIPYPNNSNFGMQRGMCVHGADVYMGKTYTRYLNNGVWSDWDALARSSDIAALEARITALEAKG